jgi:hypothetical protein
VQGVYASGGYVYAATFGGLGISNNNGLTWTNYNFASGLANNNVTSVFELGGTIYAGTSNGLSVSTNGGSSWTNYTTAEGLGSNSINGIFADAGFVYVATNGGLSVAPLNAAVPEPGQVAASVLALAGAGLYWWGRRRKPKGPQAAVQPLDGVGAVV